MPRSEAVQFVHRACRVRRVHDSPADRHAVERSDAQVCARRATAAILGLRTIPRVPEPQTSVAYGCGPPTLATILQLSGVLPALVTPMRAPGEIDVAGFTRLVERAMDDGASGVLVAGSTGEGQLLAPADRRALTVAAREITESVLACASGASLDDVHADVERLAGAGVAAVLALAPGVLPLQPEEVVAAHAAIAERASVPTLAYHIPQYTGSPLTAEAVAELARQPGLVGLKDSSDDAARRASFVTAGGAGFAVLTGHAPTLARAMADGASGAILAIANLRQRPTIELLAAVAAGDDTLVRQLQASLTRCEEDLRVAGRSMPAVLKAALQLEGVIEERWCVPPLRSLAPDRLDLVRTALLR